MSDYTRRGHRLLSPPPRSSRPRPTPPSPTREGAPGQEPETQEWSTPDGRRAVIHYDHRGITEVTREALTPLLEAAGLSRVHHDDREGL